MPDPIVIVATVLLMLPMAYFLMAAPAFLLVKLDIPAVTQLLRVLFSAYYLVLAIAASAGTLGFLMVGRITPALAIGLIAALAVVARRWFLEQIDREISLRDAGDAEAVWRLRKLHWGGMLCNAVQLGVVIAGIPYLVAPT
ncbi:MAG: hypothetical protein WCH83_00765 [Alphaproteobacteria bacterium]